MTASADRLRIVYHDDDWWVADSCDLLNGPYPSAQRAEAALRDWIEEEEC